MLQLTYGTGAWTAGQHVASQTSTPNLVWLTADGQQTEQPMQMCYGDKTTMQQKFANSLGTNLCFIFKNTGTGVATDWVSCTQPSAVMMKMALCMRSTLVHSCFQSERYLLNDMNLDTPRATFVTRAS